MEASRDARGLGLLDTAAPLQSCAWPDRRVNSMLVQKHPAAGTSKETREYEKIIPGKQPGNWKQQPRGVRVDRYLRASAWCTHFTPAKARSTQKLSSSMADARDSPDAPDLTRGGETLPEPILHELQEQQEQMEEQYLQRLEHEFGHQDGLQLGGELPGFDLGSESCTPQMFMDEMEADPTGSPCPVHFAVVVNRADVVRFMFDKCKGYDVDTLDGGGSTPLRKAVTLGHMSVVRALLDAGADVSLRFQDDRSALDRAASRGYVGISRAIVEHGADMNAVGADGRAAIHHAAAAGKAGVVSLLCHMGAAFDELDGEGYTPLHLCAISGHVATSRILLAAGADVTRQGSLLSLSPLAFAAAKGNVDVLRVILGHAGADVNAETAGVTALHAAAALNNVEAIDVLVGAGASVDHVSGGGGTPLHLAVSRGSGAAVLLLLRHGASINKQSATGRTPLHSAAVAAGTQVNIAELVDLLLRQGADETVRNIDGQTAADLVGSQAENLNSREVARVRELLANAPADRAWRRRGFLVMCRARYPGGRVRLGQGCIQRRADMAEEAGSSADPSEAADDDWAGVASMLMGVGADPISRKKDGADLIFEAIIGFL